MKIVKIFALILGVAGFCVPVSLIAQDSLSQAQAREAVRQKIAELNAQEAATQAGTPATTATKKSKERKPTAPPTDASSSPVTTAPAPVSARLEQKSDATIKAEKAAAAAEEKRQAEEARIKARAEAEERKRFAAEEKRRAEEAKARAAAEAQAVTVVKSGKTKSEKPKPAATPETPAKSTAIEAPPSGLPVSKESKLAELLGRYKADAISPEEYHKERGRILAEP